MEMEWVLGLRHDALTPLFLALTFLGDPTFFLVVLPLGYWLGRRELFYRLTLLLLFSAFLNAALKGLFQVPRPTTVPHLVLAHGWSFPSGHAQIAAVMWIYLAWELRRRWFWPVAVALVAGVSASRVYLGVHRPVDILVGATVGVVTVLFVRRWLDPAPAWWQGLSLAKRSVGIAVGTLAAFLFLPGGSWAVSKLAGFMILFWILALYEPRRVGYVAPEGPGRGLAVALLGLAVAFGLRYGLKLGFGDLPLGEVSADFLRYAAIGGWIAYGGPWVFRRLGLSSVGRVSAS